MSELVAYHLPGAWDLPSVSPFCLKLDGYLRLTGIPHKDVTTPTPFGGPKGKAPWIEHKGRKVGDSGFIIDYLRAEFSVDPESALSPSEKGVAVAMRRLMEENLYWTMVHDRWMDDRNWAVFKNVVLGGLSAPMRTFIGPLARRNVRAQLKGHGMGMHPAADIHAIGCRDLGALSDFLGNKPYFMGEAPTELDAVAYGFLANILLPPPIVSPIKDYGRSKANLMNFLERFRKRFYG
ncbi:MAG: glutathione S-transferase family protein [Micropepsaceae bacterium]